MTRRSIIYSEKSVCLENSLLYQKYWPAPMHRPHSFDFLSIWAGELIRVTALRSGRRTFELL